MSKEQADRCITGRSDWKKIVSVSDEVKAELAAVVKQDFISTNGQSIPEGTRRNDVINKYLIHSLENSAVLHRGRCSIWQGIMPQVWKN